MQNMIEILGYDIPMRDVLLVHAISTTYMMGLIWFVQLVHYPLFAQVGREAHLVYHRQHVQKTTWAVGPPMIMEAMASYLLFSTTSFGYNLPSFGLMFLLIIWLSTALLQVPCHNQLVLGFEASVHRRLVWSNWLRTLAWSLRAMIAIWLLR